MASAQVVETSVTNNSPSQDSYHPDDLFQSRYHANCYQFTRSLCVVGHLFFPCNCCSSIYKHDYITGCLIKNSMYVRLPDKMSRALMSRHAKSHEPCRGVCRNRVSSFQVCLTGCLLIVGVSFVVAVFFFASFWWFSIF